MKIARLLRAGNYISSLEEVWRRVYSSDAVNCSTKQVARTRDASCSLLPRVSRLPLNYPREHWIWTKLRATIERRRDPCRSRGNMGNIFRWHCWFRIHCNTWRAIRGKYTKYTRCLHFRGVHSARARIGFDRVFLKCRLRKANKCKCLIKNYVSFGNCGEHLFALQEYRARIIIY